MNKKTLIGLIVAAVLAVLIFFAIRDQRIYTHGFEKKYRDSMASLNNLIQKKNDSIAVSQKVVGVYQDSIAHLQAKKDSLSTKIVEVTAQTHQKLTEVDHYSSATLNDFFIQKYHAMLCPPTDSTLRKIVKDLVAGDGCATELPLVQGKLDFAETQLTDKDKIISEKDHQINLTSDIVTAGVKKNELMQTNVDYLTDRYKRLRRNDRIKVGGGVAVIVGMGAVLIKNALKK